MLTVLASLVTAGTCPALHLDILVHLLDITEIFPFWTELAVISVVEAYWE